MLKLTILGTFIAAVAATRSYGDRYIFYIRQPSDCGDSTTCPTSTSYKACGRGQCVEGICGDWVGYKNYCCSVVHGTTLSPYCNDTIFTDFFDKFESFDTSGTPAYEGGASCPLGDDGTPGGFIGEGIEDPSGTTCCSLDKDAFALYQNASWPYNSSGDLTRARCVDPLFPVEAAQTSSGSAPTSAPSNTRSGSGATPTSGGSSPVSTSSTGATASTSPNAASNNRFAVAAGAVPIVWLLALLF